MKEKRLGKGLDFLLGETTAASPASDLVNLHPDDLRPNRFQPRTVIDQAAIDTLAASIREQGVLQPILVRKTDTGYEIVAGERRWRACKSLGMTSVPAVVREMGDRESLGAALVENVQREDLNAIEKGRAYAQLTKLFNLTQEEVAKRIGIDRSTVANFVRLLDLPAEVQEHVSRGTISMGHARALLSAPDAQQMVALCKRLVKEEMSVRKLEATVAAIARAKPAPKRRDKDANVADLEDRLRKRLGTQVHIRHGRKKGRIEVEYYSPQDLNRLIALLGV